MFASGVSQIDVIIIPISSEMEVYDQNVTVQVPDVEEVFDDKDNFVAEVWIGVILTMLVVACACSMCGFLVYSRIQIWKRRAQQSEDIESIPPEEQKPYTEPLPSYTAVSGLPSYNEALEQLKKIQEEERCRKKEENDDSQTSFIALSAQDLLHKCKNDDSLS